MEAATRMLRAGLLLHGSTAEESYLNTSRISWASKGDPATGDARQGIAIGDDQVMLTDLYDTLFEMNGLKEHLKNAHPSLTDTDLEAYEWVMWLLVSMVQMFQQLLSVESDKDLGIQEWVAMMTEKYGLSSWLSGCNRRG